MSPFQKGEWNSNMPPIKAIQSSPVQKGGLSSMRVSPSILYTESLQTHDLAAGNPCMHSTLSSEAYPYFILNPPTNNVVLYFRVLRWGVGALIRAGPMPLN